MTRIGNMRNAYLNDLVVDGVVRNKINNEEIGLLAMRGVN